MPGFYPASDETVVLLIRRANEGSERGRLAARLLLACLRRFHAAEEIEACLEEFETSDRDLAREVRQLARDVGITHH